MAQKKSYSRYFIILQEDEKGYSLAADKLPSGYTKLEMKNEKCKISYYVQNLKKEKGPFYLLLICSKKEINKLIKLGELNIDDHGRAEVFYEYSVEDICSTGIAMDKITGAAIVKTSGKSIVPVMSGFSSTDIPNWRNYEMVEAGEIKEVKEIKEEEAVVKSIFDEYEASIVTPVAAREELRVEEVKEEVREEIIEVKEEIEEIKKDLEDIRETKEELRAEVEEKIEEPVEEPEKEMQAEEPPLEEDFRHKHEHKYEDMPIGPMGSFFKELVGDYEELKGIGKEIKNCRWFKIPVTSMEDMASATDYDRYTVLYYPMLAYYPYIRRHKHFLMGYKCDKEGMLKYLVYSIPGCKSKAEQPYGGKSGFVTWIPLREGEESENSMGYWMMFYDFKNSTIVIPMK